MTYDALVAELVDINVVVLQLTDDVERRMEILVGHPEARRRGTSKARRTEPGRIGAPVAARSWWASCLAAKRTVRGRLMDKADPMERTR